MNKLHKGIIVGLILVLPFWLWVFGAFGATYFMRADGTAANKAAASGPCGTGGNCMSIATHDGETFSGDDIIKLCDDGGVYRDQMDIPSSGTSGHPIIYQAESGDTPIISGADIITTWISNPPVTGGLALYVDGQYSTITTTGSGISQWHDLSGNSNHLVQTVDADRPLSTTVDGFIAVQFDSANTEDLDFTNALDLSLSSIFAVIKVADTASFRTITSGTDGGSLQFRVENDEKLCLVKKDVIGIATSTTDITTGSIQVVGATWDETNYKFWVNGVVDNSGANAQTITANNNRVGSKSGNYFDGEILALLIYTVELSEADGDKVANWLSRRYTNNNTYSEDLTTESKLVFFDSVQGNKQTTISDVDSEFDWYWVDSVLYVYSSVAHPDITYTTPGIEALQYDKTINCSGEDYITFSGLGFSKNGNNGAALQIGSGCSNITVVSCAFSNSSTQHIGIWGDSTGNILIQKSTFEYSGLSHGNGDGSAIDVLSTGTPAVAVEKCTFTHVGDWAGAGYLNHGIYHKSGTLIWRYNYHYNGGTESGACVKIAGNTENACKIYCNIFSDGGGTQEWGIMATAGSDHLVYNNVFYGLNIGIWYYTGSTGMTVKNNIFMSETSKFIFASAIAGLVSDHNDFYDGPVTPFRISATHYNFADWKTNSSQDSNSKNSDPLFTNVAGDDFTLKFNSPCRHGAVYLPDYETKLRPNASWPSDVTIMDDILSIGAYGIYRGSAGM